MPDQPATQGDIITVIIVVIAGMVVTLLTGIAVEDWTTKHIDRAVQRIEQKVEKCK